MNLKKQKWTCSLHEGAHLLVGKYLLPRKPFRAEVVFSTRYKVYAGLCSNPFTAEDLILEAIFTAAGYEAARYSHIEPTAPYTEPAEQEPQPEGTPAPEPQEAEKVRTLLTCTGDREFLAQAIAQLYPQYHEIKHWYKAHRRFRARARLIIKRNLPELLKIANELYEHSFVEHNILVRRPPTGVGGHVDA